MTWGASHLPDLRSSILPPISRGGRVDVPARVDKPVAGRGSVPRPPSFPCRTAAILPLLSAGGRAAVSTKPFRGRGGGCRPPRLCPQLLTSKAPRKASRISPKNRGFIAEPEGNDLKSLFYAGLRLTTVGKYANLVGRITNRKNPRKGGFWICQEKNCCGRQKGCQKIR